MAIQKSKTANEDLLDPRQFKGIDGAADLVDVSNGFIRKLLQDRKLRRYKLGTRTLVNVGELLALVKADE